MSEPEVMIDAHHHFFRSGSGEYPWMKLPGYEFLRGDFGEAELSPTLATNSVAATVLVQTWSSYEESVEYLALAEMSNYVRGVVGWVDLAAPDVGEMIDRLRASPGGNYLVGVRHQVHDEPDPDWLSRDTVRRGLRAVARADLTFDLLVRPRELGAAITLARELPELRLVVDHAGKPNIASGGRAEWLQLMAPLAALDRVDCKISGLVTEADWSAWTLDEVVAYAVDVIEMFGVNRCMFGSDWPVCLVAASYDEVVAVVTQALSGATTAERSAVLAGTATRAYGLMPMVSVVP